MPITSTDFAVFASLVLGLYFLVPARWQNRVLLAASVIFLAAWRLEFAIILPALAVANFHIGRRIVAGNPRKKWWLRGGIALNLAALLFFKYAGFYVQDFERLLGDVGIATEAGTWRILLPIGLSFFAVQAISYLLDLNQKLLEPEQKLIHFALYMLYFPRMVSGPIERAREFLPRIAEPRPFFDETVLSRAFLLIMVGLVRKIAIADVLLTITPTDVFSHPSRYLAPELFIWLLAYAFTIYNDFAGYTSIVRGVSLLFGIELSRNFDTPYLARNFTEFWNRWHMTLSFWLRDYIFTPLTRALLRRKYKSRHPLTLIAPPLVTMIVSALWHDIAAGMLLWGLLHGLFQVVERLRGLVIRTKAPDSYPAWRQVASMGVVFTLAVLAWVPFRTDIPATLDYWTGLVNLSQWAGFADWSNYLYGLIVALIGVSFCLDLPVYFKGELFFAKPRPIVKAVLINAAVFLIIFGVAAQGEAPPPFIYQGF